MDGERTRRVGIFGGTFSPPHIGHIAAARAFIDKMHLDYLYVIPTATPPHKEMEVAVSAADRLRMCELAFSGMDGVIVSDIEIRRGGRSYTVDTLREFSAPDVRLFLLCGTDMILTLDSWYQAEEIFKLCYPVYIRRENDPIIEKKLLLKLAEYKEKYSAIVRRLPSPAVEISSTAVRRAIAYGGDASGVLTDEVSAYIAERGLYR